MVSLRVLCSEGFTGDGRDRSVRVIIYFGFQQCAETNVSNSVEDVEG